jgi:SNF2 family DNA or RNA helicase
VIDGRTPTEPKVNQATGEPIPSRSELVADFQTNPDTLVFVAQIQTAGLGITLHTATLAVFYSMDFNYANYAQALARIHRIGQRRPCTYVHLIAEGTIDLKVLEAMRRKEDLAAKIVDNWREVFADPAAPKDGGKIRKGGKKTNDARDIDKD